MSFELKHKRSSGNVFMMSMVLLLLIFSGCKRDPMPKNALHKKQFTAVLMDMQLAETMYSDRFRTGLDTVKLEQLIKAVYEKHEITEDQFLASVLYYSRHPSEYGKIMTDINNQLSTKLEELDPQRALEIKQESAPIPERKDPKRKKK